MYQALYRKYRPRSFSDVTGQKHITQTLSAQVASDRLTHAYLFIGTRGTGKTTCAKILSRAVNCLNPVNGDPCNECQTCKGIEEGSILDVVEIDAASHNGVDDVREIRDEAIYSPAAAKKRVYILDEAHMLSNPASNALLKILEEPPEHIIFILATTELHKVSATIQSRCQKFSFRRLTIEEISKRLNEIASKEGLKITQEAVIRLSMLADGSMRDAISLLDQCVTVTKTIDLEYIQNTLGLCLEHELLKLVENLAGRDVPAVLETIDSLYKDGKDMAALLGELSAIFRDILIVSLTPSSGLLSSGVSPDRLSEMTKQITPDSLFKWLDIARNAVINLPRTGVSKLVIEMCLIRMCDDNETEKTKVQLQPQKNNKAPGKTPPAEQPGEDSVKEQQENKPEPEPSPKPEPKPVPGGSILSQVVSHINDESLLIYFSDSTQVWAVRDDGLLTIYMTNEFSANMVKSMFMETLKDAAKKAFEQDINVTVEIAENKTISDKHSKLEKLKAFGDIVKVE